MKNTIEENAIKEVDNSLIVVKQLPIIEEQLHIIKQRFEEETASALSLECSEETLQIVRKARADLTRVFKALEDKRKTAKNAIIAPYDAFEAVYRECVTDVYKPCDDQLAGRIHEVEDRIKDQKRDEAKQFFDEYAFSKGIDFVEFERVGLNITMNSSKKSLKNSIKAFLDKVCEELDLIDTQPYKSEILVEYKASLNVAAAITAVNNRHKAIEAEEAKRQREPENKGDISIPETEPAELLTAPAKAVATPENEPTDKVYEVSFTVRATMEKIKALKAYLKEGEYDYE